MRLRHRPSGSLTEPPLRAVPHPRHRRSMSDARHDHRAGVRFDDGDDGEAGGNPLPALQHTPHRETDAFTPTMADLMAS